MKPGFGRAVGLPSNRTAVGFSLVIRSTSLRPVARAALGAALSLLMAAAAGCGGAQVPADATTTVISIQKLDCASCAETLVANLSKEEGVYEARFDKRKAELTVVALRGYDAFGAAKRLMDDECVLVLGAGKGSYRPWTEAPPSADVKVIAKDGEDVPDLAAHVVAGKVTLLDFGAPWCEPCRTLDEHVVKMLATRTDVAYRKLDIGDWDTPLAMRYLRGVPSLPYVIVYGRDGKKVDAIAGLDLPRLDAAIARGAR